MFRSNNEVFSQTCLKAFEKKESCCKESITHVVFEPLIIKGFVTLLCLIFIFNWDLIYAARYSADISYLIADFKYSKEHGVKICEVQHGSLSALLGDLYLSGGDGSISPGVADFFSLFPAKKWAAGVIYLPLKRSLALQGWEIETSINTMLSDPVFLERAALPPEDSSLINSYTGMAFDDFDLVRHFSRYQQAYPGILFLNAVTFPYWRDKYKMNVLFERNAELMQYKADWRIYPKKYEPFLSDKIQEEMPSELYVIKPRGETLANGVIVVANSELDAVLKMILDPLPILEKHPDKRYSYWFKNKDDTFLIEKYYQSDYLSFPLPASKATSTISEYHYDATMRLAFILQHDGGKMTYHGLGGFWKLPCKALEEEGTLNEVSITCGEVPFYKAIDPVLLKEVDTQMERAMLLLYEVMLSDSQHARITLH